MHQALGPEVFSEALKNPHFFSWAENQVITDLEDRDNLILQIFEALKPWLNSELFTAIEKKKKKEEEKLERIAKTDAKNVEVTNLYDVMMKRMGIDTKK